MFWVVFVLLLLTVSLAAQAQVPEGWFPFVIGESGSESLANVASYSSRPAGAEGFVTWRDGHFYDGGGRRLRFLGTNVTFASAFPDKDLAPRIAARMAALGINCVRFHHMDMFHRPSGIWDPAFADHQHLDAEQLDRLDWFIYQLKQNGVYADLNLHVSRTLDANDGFENSDKLPDFGKGADNFTARMIELQRNYARDLLTHRNPYTGTTYAEEPCVALIELNNENSLLGFAYGSTLHNLPEPYRGELKQYWNDFLRSKYGDTAGLRNAWDEGTEPLGAEMLRNRDFAAGVADWVLESRNPQADVFEVADDPQAGRVLHARLNQLGVNPWDFQIHQLNLPLQEGKPYTLSFRMKADPERAVHVGARWQVDDWRNIGLDETIRVTPEWQAFTFTFRAHGVRATENRISFNCQNELGDVWLADVSLKPGGVLGLAADQRLEDGTVEFAAPRSTRQARRDWFEFIVELERRYTQGLYQYLKQDLGVRAAVIDTQATYGGLGGVWRESQLDYIDNHAYWQHPFFPGRPWDGANWTIGNTSMTRAHGSDTLTYLAQYRVAGMPYTVSEYNHPAPNDYRAECMPMLAAMAGLQDWDGIFQFDYGSQPSDWSEARIQGFFQMVTDPAAVAFFPVAANLFRRGDVQAAREEVRLGVPRAKVVDWLTDRTGDLPSLWREVGVPQAAAIQHRLALEWTDGSELSGRAVTVPEGEPTASDTGEITWHAEADKGAFLVNTPRTKVALGDFAGTEMRLGRVTLQFGPTSNGWVAFAMTSMDDLPLRDSRRMLVVAMSRVENQAMEWNERRTSVSDKWGHGPTICEQVPVKLTVLDRELRAWALDGAGQRVGEPCASGATLDLQAPTVWYEVGE